MTNIAAVCLSVLAPAAAANVDGDAREPAVSSAASGLRFAAENALRREAAVARGDTLLRILLQNGVGQGEAGAAAQALERVADARALRPGQTVTLFLWPRPRPAAGNRLIGFALPAGGDGAAVVHREIDGRFAARRMPGAEALALLESILVAPDDETSGFFGRDVRLRRGGTVGGVLVAAGASAGDAHEAARLLQRSVNLRRLRPGQTLTALFRREDGAPRLAGVALTTPDGRTHAVGVGEDGRWRPGPPAEADDAATPPPSAATAASEAPDPVEAGAEAPPPADAAGFVGRDVRLGRGGTVGGALVAAGASAGDAHEAARLLQRSVNLRRLRPGQSLTVFFRHGDGAPRLAGVALTTRDGRTHTVGVGEDGRWRPGAPAGADTAASPPPAATAASEGPDPAEAVAEAPPPADAAGFVGRDVRLGRGGTVGGALVAAGASAGDAHEAARLLQRSVNLRRLRPGQSLTVFFRHGDGAPRLAGVALTTRDGRTHTVGVGEDGRWRPGAPAAADDAATPPPAAAVAASEGPDPAEAVAEAPPPADAGGFVGRDVRLGRGGTVGGALVAAGASAGDAHEAARLLQRSVDLRRLRPGQSLTVFFRRSDGAPRLAGVALTTRDGRRHTVGVGEDGRWRPGAPAAADDAATPPPAAAVDDAAGPPPAAAAEVAAEHVGAAVAVQLAFSRGDTLALLLRRAGAPAADIDAAARGLRRVYDPRRIREGRRLRVEIDRPAGKARLRAVVLETGRRGGVAVERGAGGRFLARAVAPADIEAALAAPDAAAAARAATSLAVRLGDTPRARLVDESPRRVEVGKGATFIGLLLDAGFARADTQAAFEAIDGLYDPRDLRVGDVLEYARAEAEPGAPPRLGQVHIDIDSRTRLSIVRGGDGAFVAGFVEKVLRRDLAAATGGIDSSLYEAMESAGVPPAVIMESLGLLSQGFDLQRDVQRGDTFALVFETFFDDRGERVETGDVVHVSLVLSGKPRNVYRHVGADGRVDYFDERGESARMALMRTPIDGARLTSRFGMRRHPISGYNRQHKGVDFGAPTGTPIYAAGDGVVERASRFGAYGRYVRIRHSSVYKTAYAHLSAYAEGIYPGKRVRQGETIGYVGSSGRSTGPHLHYEVIYNGRQVNPLSVELPSGDPIGDSERAAFAETRRTVARVLRGEPAESSVAAGGPAAARPEAIDPFFPARLP